MTKRRRLTKGLIRPEGSFRLYRGLPVDDNARRFKAYMRRKEREWLRDPETIRLKHLAWSRMKRRWRARAGLSTRVRVRWPR